MRINNLRNKIVLYFFLLLIMVFMIFLFLFNTSLGIFARRAVTEEIVNIERSILNVSGSDDSSELLKIKDKIIENTNNVRILFLDQDMNLMNPADYYLSHFPEGIGKTNVDEQENEKVMLLNQIAVYNHTTSDIANYVKSGFVDINDEATQITVNNKDYLVDFIKIDDSQEDYVLAYTNLSIYKDFIRAATFVLVLAMVPSMFFCYALIVYLTNQFTVPLTALIHQSSRIGEGNFEKKHVKTSHSELRNLNNSLNETAEKLKTFNENQKIFFQNVSHELRTPLTSIKGYSEGIQYGVFTPEEGVSIILQESEKLESLVEDILYLSRLEAGESVVDPKTTVLLSIFMKNVVKQVKNKANMVEKHISLEIKRDILMKVHHKELERGVFNIINNALNYATSKILVTADIVNSDILITIQDDGKGIEEEMLKNLFSRFRKGTKGSHGIGLSISKAAVEMHGGKITASNTEEGARFTIKIPCKEVMETEEKTEGQE